MGSLIEQHPHLAADARESSKEGDIEELMFKLRKRLGGLRAVRENKEVPFAVKSAKVLMIKFRKACDQLRILCYPVAVQSQLSPTGKGAFVHAVYTIRFKSLDDKSFLDVVCNSLGGDNQDKAAGKCFTYGWKYSVIYSCLLPDADIPVEDDEDDVRDTDDDAHPTNEPGGISKPVLSTFVERACAATTVQELQSVVTEMRQVFNATEIRSVASTLVDKKMALEQASFVEEQATIQKEVKGE